eukprot:PhF_6_TR15948/c0_g2_i1/m.24809
MSQSAHPHSLPPGDVQLLDDLKDAYMNKRLREFLNHHTSHDLVNVIDLPIQDHSNVLYLLCREKFGNNHEDIELLIQRGAKVTLPYPHHKIRLCWVKSVCSIRSSVELIPHQTTSSLSPPPTTTTTPRQSTPPYDAEQATLAKTIM